MTDYTFTLGDILAAGPCGQRPGDPGGWARGLRMAGQPHDNPDLSIRVSIGDVALRCGADDAFWCLRLIPDRQVRVRAFMPAVRRASVHTEDARVHDCIAAINRWLAGDDSVDLWGARAEEAARAAEREARAAAEAAWAARAARAARAAWAAWEARAAAEAAWAAERAAWAAWEAEDAAAAAEDAVRAAEAAARAAARAKGEDPEAAREAERAAQVADLVALFPPLHGEQK